MYKFYHGVVVLKVASYIAKNQLTKNHEIAIIISAKKAFNTIFFAAVYHSSESLARIIL